MPVYEFSMSQIRWKSLRQLIFRKRLVRSVDSDFSCPSPDRIAAHSNSSVVDFGGLLDLDCWDNMAAVTVGGNGT